MGDFIKRIKKLREHRGIGVFFIITIPLIVFISCGEEYDYKFWRELSSLLIIVLIFTISSLWAVRTSAFYSSAQERNNFYHYVKDNEKEYKIINKVNLKRIIEDPASQYLRSARSSRTHAIIYNMTLFYLFICIFFLFIQFLLNLKEGNITIWFCMLLFVVGSVIFYLVYKVINEGTDYLKNKIKRLKKIRDFFPAEIGILIVLDFILLIAFSYVLWKNFCPQTILLEETHWFSFHFKITVLSLINILLFSIASYLAYLSLRIFQNTISSPGHYNGFVIWTYDSMDKIFPFLGKKKDAQINPDVIKENEMLNLWKWSLILNLKEIFGHMRYNGSIDETHRENEEYIETLIGTLTASEWEDPSVLYLCAVVRRLLSFLKIDNCPKSNESVEKPRYEHAEEAAEKRWDQKIKKLKDLEKKKEKSPKNREEWQETNCKVRGLIENYLLTFSLFYTGAHCYLDSSFFPSDNIVINTGDYSLVFYSEETNFLRDTISNLEDLSNHIGDREFLQIRRRIIRSLNALIETYKDRTKN